MGRPKGSKNKPKVNNTPSVEKETTSSSNTYASSEAPNKIEIRSSSKTPTIKKTINTPSGTKSVKEMKDALQKYENLKEIFAATNEALQLVDLTKTETRTYQTYSRETLRTYLKSPKSYESQIRNLSKYLYRLCYDYKRICTFYATMICGDAFNIIPLADPTQENNPDDILKKYYETSIRWQRMDFANELVKLLLVAWREDTVYAYVYDDSDQEGGTCFFHVLDGDYCRICAIEEGVFRFAFDFSYFRSHKSELEFWDIEFQQKYRKYESDSSLRWQELESERQICFKVNSDDPTMDYPPFAQLFEQIIDLIDLSSIQHVKDALSVYKLLVARLQPLSGTDTPDDFEVDINTAIKYYNRLAESLPPEIAACISPLPIEAIEFKDNNNTQNTDMLSSAMSNIFKHIGGQILDNSKTGTTIYTAQIIADMEMGQSTLLPQVQRWINLYFNYVIGDDHAFIKYIDGVSPYTRKDKRKELLESAQNGLPTKLEISILDGKSPLETTSMLYLENEVLGLTDKLIPLSTSYTKSGSEAADPVTGGAPTKDSTELTDEGSSTREK